MLRFLRKNKNKEPEVKLGYSLNDRTVDLRGENIFGFRTQGSNFDMVDRGITYDEATMNLIAFGSTGSGKTATVMRPVLKKLVQDGCGGLVLDIKGDYSAFLLSECDEDNLVLVGEGPGTKPVNILSGMNTDQFRGFLSSISMANGAGNDGFWGTGGVRDAVLIFSFIAAKYGRTATLSEIYGHLNNPKDFCLALDSYISLANGEIPEFLDRCIEPCISEDFSILKVGLSQTVGGEGNKDSKDLQQYTWHTQMLKSQLRPFYENEKLQEMFCHEGETSEDVSFYDMAVRGKAVCLNLNYAKYGGAAKLISKIVKSRYYSDVFGSEPEVIKSRLDGRYTVLLVDEYQDYIVTDSGSLGLMIDDNSFFDKSRAYGQINILSTQGVSSLLAKTGSKFVVNSILQNIRTRVVLPTPDSETADLIGHSSLLSQPLSRGQGDPEFIVHKHANSSSDAFLEAAFSKGFIDSEQASFKWSESAFVRAEPATVSEVKMVSTRKYMDLTKANKGGYINDEGDIDYDFNEPGISDEELDGLDEEPLHLKPLRSEIDLIYQLRKRSELKRGLNVIICPEKSKVLEDFCLEFNRRREEILVACKQILQGSEEESHDRLQVESNIAAARFHGGYDGNFLFFPIPKGKEEELFHDTLISVIKVSNVVDVSTITVIRGGGDNLDHLYRMTWSVVNEIDKAENMPKLCVSIGHSSDRPELQEKADISASTPTQLGSVMADHILEEEYGLSVTSVIESLNGGSATTEDDSILDEFSDLKDLVVD